MRFLLCVHVLCAHVCLCSCSLCFVFPFRFMETRVRHHSRELISGRTRTTLSTCALCLYTCCVCLFVVPLALFYVVWPRALTDVLSDSVLAVRTADVLPIHRRVLGSLASVCVQVDTRSTYRGGYVWEHVTSICFCL